MIEADTLEKIQARNGVLLEEMREEAERFTELLAAWKASGGEDLGAELEAQVITLRIHAQALEKSLEDESEASRKTGSSLEPSQNDQTSRTNRG